MNRRHPVIWTGRDIVSETIFTDLAFLHWIERRELTCLLLNTAGKRKSPIDFSFFTIRKQGRTPA
jgi:hypothetical protein